MQRRQIAAHAQRRKHCHALGVCIGIGVYEFNNHFAVGVVVWIGENHFVAREAVEGTQQIFALGARRHAVECGWMERAQQCAFRNRCAQFLLKFLTRWILHVGDVVHTHSAHIVHPLGVFAQLNHAAAIGFGFSEVDVAHFCYAVADAFVVSALTYRSSCYVRNGNAENQCRARHGKHLVAVAQNQQQMRTQLVEHLCHTAHALAHGVHRACSAIALNSHRHHARDVQPVVFNLMPGAAIFLAQVHVCGNNLQLHVATPIKLLSHRAEQSPVGSRTCHYAYLSFHTSRLYVVKKRL